MARSELLRVAVLPGFAEVGCEQHREQFLRLHVHVDASVALERLIGADVGHVPSVQ